MPALYTSAEVSKVLGLTPSALRSCLRAAELPSPRRNQRYSFQDLILLKTCKGLREADLSTVRIRRLLNSLRCQIPEDQHLSAVRIYATGRRIVVWDGTAHWQPDSGQFLFSFDPIRLPKPRTLPQKLKETSAHAPQKRTAEDWLALGESVEERSPEEALKAYMQAIGLDSTFAPAYLHLGRLSYESGKLREAEAYYRKATRWALKEMSGPYNLAVVLEELGNTQGAVEAYLEAIKRQSTFHAHYHLAMLYETLGKPTAAIRHYHAARKLRNTAKR